MLSLFRIWVEEFLCGNFLISWNTVAYFQLLISIISVYYYIKEINNMG